MMPARGETWFIDGGMAKKPRWAMVVSAPDDGRLALVSVVKITRQFAGTPYEITLPRVPWLPEQSYINGQSIQPIKRCDFLRKAPGQFDRKIFEEVVAAVKLWLLL
jgi:mRNA-degrading endonuclease toxin of MazEF toxin-antitoxin module